MELPTIDLEESSCAATAECVFGQSEVGEVDTLSVAKKIWMEQALLKEHMKNKTLQSMSIQFRKRRC